VIIITLLVFMPIASADTILEILEKKFLDFAHNMEHSGMYIQDKQEQAHQHIRGWVDIVGYDNLTCIDGVHYVPGVPADHAIIKYDVWDEGVTSTFFITNRNVDFIKITDERVFADDNCTTVEIDIYMMWHTSVKKCRTVSTATGSHTYCWISKNYTHEYATFSDTDISPLVFTPLDCTNTSVDVVIYNNTVSPKTTFKVLGVPDHVVSINYTYENETILHYHGTATQERTDKNCPCMQINSTNIWKDEGNLSQFNGFAIVPHMNFTEANLTVTLNSPYTAHEIDNITVYEERWHGAGDTFSVFLLPFLGIIAVLRDYWDSINWYVDAGSEVTMSLNTEQVWKIGDCLELLPGIPDKSIDMILTDLPYGTTACSWDTVISFEPLWEQYKRIIKDNGAIVLTANQPFTSALIMSNIKMFRYSWVWVKSQAVGHLNGYKMPMKKHEDVCVFYKQHGVYNYQLQLKNKKNIRPPTTKRTISNCYSHHKKDSVRMIKSTESLPSSIIYFENCQDNNHPTQKPIKLFEYLIKTYTNEGDTVHDSCLGSGTTLEACLNTNRNCIGFEISDEWVPHYRKILKSDNSKLTDAWSV